MAPALRLATGDELADALIAEYRLAGSAADTSGNGRHGTVHGVAPTADRFGNPGQAYRFDGIDDYIEVAPPPRFSPEALSVSVWVNYQALPRPGWSNCILAQDDGNDEDQSRRVFQLSTDGGRLVWHRMIGARDPMVKRRVRPGVWYHVVAVHDRGMNRLYLDGILCDTVEHRLWTHPDQPLHIGRKGTPEPYFFFRGAISDLRLYDRPLRDPEIRELLHENGWQVPALPELPYHGDPLSGRWGQDGVVFLDLIYRGGFEVTGRIMAGQPRNMAPIAMGRFDPETGSLRLEGRARHPESGEPVEWSIEGMLDRDEICVVARFDGYQGNFILTRSGARLRPTRRSIRSQLGALAFRWRRLWS